MHGHIVSIGTMDKGNGWLNCCALIYHFIYTIFTQIVISFFVLGIFVTMASIISMVNIMVVLSFHDIGDPGDYFVRAVY